MGSVRDHGLTDVGAVLRIRDVCVASRWLRG